jgi:hypothetical protein
MLVGVNWFPIRNEKKYNTHSANRRFLTLLIATNSKSRLR